MPNLLVSPIVSAALALGAGFYVAWHWQDATIAGIELAHARMVANAEHAAINRQSRQDAITMQAAVNAATAQQKIADQRSNIAKEIGVHVTHRQDARDCVTYGFVRVLDAAIAGADPASFSLPAGKSDDSCAPVKASDLAANVARNYLAARSNADELAALQAWVGAQQRAATQSQ